MAKEERKEMKKCISATTCLIVLLIGVTSCGKSSKELSGSCLELYKILSRDDKAQETKELKDVKSRLINTPQEECQRQINEIAKLMSNGDTLNKPN